MHCKYIDTHAHTYLDQFSEDESEMINRLSESGISKVIMPNVDVDTMAPMFEQEARYPEILRSALGLHPCSVKAGRWTEDLSTLEAAINANSIVAIGEIGIDLYWDTSTKDLQIEVYKRQLSWSADLGLPALIHSRDSLDLTIGIAEEMQDGRLRPVFHCFNGNVEQGKRIEAIGGFVGLGGVITYKNAGMADVLPHLTEDIMLLETDAPYLSPVPMRGKRNEPAYIVHTADKLSEYLGKDKEEICKITTRNALNLFPN